MSKNLIENHNNILNSMGIAHADIQPRKFDNLITAHQYILNKTKDKRRIIIATEELDNIIEKLSADICGALSFK